MRQQRAVAQAFEGGHAHGLDAGKDAGVDLEDGDEQRPGEEEHGQRSHEQRGLPQMPSHARREGRLDWSRTFAHLTN